MEMGVQISAFKNSSYKLFGMGLQNLGNIVAFCLTDNNIVALSISPGQKLILEKPSGSITIL